MKHSFKVGDLVTLKYHNDIFYYGDNGEMDGHEGVIKEVYPEKMYVKLKRFTATVIPEECLLMGTSGDHFKSRFEYDVPEQLPPPPKEIIVPTNKTITLLTNSTTLTVNQNF